MINGKKVLAIIPARGGSKGLPGKNILELGGKPLIAWAIEAAQKSKYIDRLILSSEDKQIISVAQDWGCEAPFIRPAELALDKTPGIDPVLHAINTLTEKYDHVVLLQPTSPFRNVADIDNCIEFCILNKAPACVSVVETSENPYWMFSMDSEKKMNHLIKTKMETYQRQLLPEIFKLNGAVYVAETAYILKNKKFLGDSTIGFKMPKKRSIDIDSKLDLFYAEFILMNDLGRKNLNSSVKEA